MVIKFDKMITSRVSSSSLSKLAVIKKKKTNIQKNLIEVMNRCYAVMFALSCIT